MSCIDRPPCKSPPELPSSTTKLLSKPIIAKNDQPLPDDLLGAFLGETYLIGHVIGKGSFGNVRLCNAGRPKHFVVAKVEVSKDGKRSRLHDEFHLLRRIRGAVGFPRVYYYCELPRYNVMILDMLGPTLNDLKERLGGKLTVKTVAQIGMQLMDRMEFLHARDILYRDIKGENLLIGLYDHHGRIHVVDFGLSRKAFAKDGRSFTPVGTPRYMSLSIHGGHASTYRDDLESIGYLLVYFAAGRLPWQGMVAATTDAKMALIHRTKSSTSLKDLCTDLPRQMAEYIQSVRSLKFNERPMYDCLRCLFASMLKSCEGDLRNLDWQKNGTVLSVAPKITQPTAVSRKHEVRETGVVDLRYPIKDKAKSAVFAASEGGLMGRLVDRRYGLLKAVASDNLVQTKVTFYGARVYL